MQRQLYGAIASSQDPSEVANKIKGIILMFSSLIIFGAALIFHITLTAGDVLTLATEISGICGLLWAVYGCILHLITWAGTVKTQTN